MLAYALINTLDKSVPSSSWQTIPVGVLEKIPPFILIPRFIMGLRELYSCNFRGRDIDTAFGFGSMSLHGAGGSTIMFADIEENESEEQSSEGEVEQGIQEIQRERSSIAL